MEKNPCKIILVDTSEMRKRAADLFGVPMGKVTFEHLQTVKRLNGVRNQWQLAEERVAKYGRGEMKGEKQ